MRNRVLFVAVLGLLGWSVMAEPVPTRIMVRAVSRDAKIIGTGVGGARITIRDANTGELLAQGFQEGGTGDTTKLIREPHPRHDAIYDTDGAAGFLAELLLESPTLLLISAEGPLAFPQATQTASKRILAFPGQDILGNGVLLEIHGFIVELLSDSSLAVPGQELPITARVRMTCGCPTEPGGLWDSDKIQVEALIRTGKYVLSRKALEFAGETSTYRGSILIPNVSEPLRLEILAGQAGEANFGHFVQEISPEMAPDSR